MVTHKTAAWRISSAPPYRGTTGSTGKSGRRPPHGLGKAFGTTKLALTGDCIARWLFCLPEGSRDRVAGSDVSGAVVPHSVVKDPRTRFPFPADSADA